MGIYVDRRQRRSKALSQVLLQPNVVAIAVFLLLVIVAGWPVLTRLNTVIIGDDIDVYINPWADWWTQQAISQRGLTLWQTDYIFYPAGADLTYHSFSHFNTAISLLLRPFVGAIAAYNLTILFNYFLIALSMFHLARYWTGSAAAGIVAGIVFAFNSHNLYQSCHPVLLGIWVLPWTALFLLKAVEAEKNGFKYAALAGFFLFLTTTVSVLMLIMQALWLAFLGVAMLITRRWRLKHWPLIVVAIGVGAVLSLPLLYPLLRASIAGGNSSFIVNPYDSFVTDIASLVTPHWHYWYIRGIYLGILPMALMVLALGRLREVRLWLALTVLALLLAIGPVPTIGGEQLDIVLPWSLPLAPVLRNMYRMNILVSLGAAMLAAYGWLVFASHLPRQRVVQLFVLAFLSLLIFADYMRPTFPRTPLSVPRFYTHVLADMPQDVSVAIVPTGRQYDKPHLLYQTFHEHKMVNGVISRSVPETRAFIRNNALLRAGYMDLDEQPLPADPRPAMEELAAAGVDYLIIEKGWRQLDDEEWEAALPFEPYYEDSQVLVYETGQ